MGIRSQIRNRGWLAPDPAGHGGKSFAWICLFSLVSHLVLFALVFWFQNFDFLPPKPRVVRVDLVSFAPGPIAEPAAGPVDPAAIKTPEVKKESVSTAVKPVPKAETPPAPIPVLKPELSLKTKPKNIKDLMAARKEVKKPVQKKQTKPKKPKPKKNPEKELEKAREALAQKVDAQNKDQINKALERIQAAIQKQNKQAQGDGASSGNGGGAQGNSPLTLYQMVMKSAFQQNWVFSDAMAGLNQNLEVKIFIKILKNGEIRDISYETRSGNQYLDESAKKAIRRAGPLPELPKGMASYELVVGFTPKGLK